VKRGEIRWYTFRAPDKRRPVLILTRDDVIEVAGTVWPSRVTRMSASNCSAHLTNLAEARAWTFAFAQGPMRDAALHEYLMAEARGGSLEVQLLNEIVDSSARDRAPPGPHRGSVASNGGSR
jgi:hypothetical protein